MEIMQALFPFESTFLDFPDAESEAVMVFFCGCDHSCPGCQNPELRYIDSLDKGRQFFTESSLYEALKTACERHRTRKVVFTGGDPLSSRNRAFVRAFLASYGQEFDVVVYTGYTRVEVLRMDVRRFKFLKCGRYDETCRLESGKSDHQFVLASSNQEFVNSCFEVISTDGVLTL